MFMSVCNVIIIVSKICTGIIVAWSKLIWHKTMIIIVIYTYTSYCLMNSWHCYIIIFVIFVSLGMPYNPAPYCMKWHQNSILDSCLKKKYCKNNQQANSFEIKSSNKLQNKVQRTNFKVQHKDIATKIKKTWKKLNRAVASDHLDG